MEYKNLSETLDYIGQLARDDYKEKLRTGQPFNSIATGKLFNSIKYRVDVTDTSIKLSFIDLPEYYINVERGQKKGENTLNREFIAKIYDWMIVRRIPNKPGLAFLIARSIAENGIKAKPYIREIKTELKNYVDDIEKAITKDISEEIKNKLNKITK